MTNEKCENLLNDLHDNPHKVLRISIALIALHGLLSSGEPTEPAINESFHIADNFIEKMVA